MTVFTIICGGLVDGRVFKLNVLPDNVEPLQFPLCW